MIEISNNLSTSDFARHGPLTDPGASASAIEDLPDDLEAARAAIAELIVHTGWAPRHDLPATAELDRTTRPVAERLQAIQVAFPGSLTSRRPHAQRTTGTCRDYALLLCSVLRHRQIPARVRCGFATYFSADRYWDHWICEYWHPAHQSWAAADAQIDRVQRDYLALDFDYSDLPTGVFLNAGQAWLMVRSGRADPSKFGHGDASGLWFMRVNVVRDLLALHGQEMSDWDSWREATGANKIIDATTLATLDRIAEETAACMCDCTIDLGLRPEIQAPPWM
jgi:hypothetical protein